MTPSALDWVQGAVGIVLVLGAFYVVGMMLEHFIEEFLL